MAQRPVLLRAGPSASSQARGSCCCGSPTMQGPAHHPQHAHAALMTYTHSCKRGSSSDKCSVLLTPRPAALASCYRQRRPRHQSTRRLPCRTCGRNRACACLAPPPPPWRSLTYTRAAIALQATLPGQMGCAKGPARRNMQVPKTLPYVVTRTGTKGCTESGQIMQAVVSLLQWCCHAVHRR